MTQKVVEFSRDLGIQNIILEGDVKIYFMNIKVSLQFYYYYFFGVLYKGLFFFYSRMTVR